MFIVSKADVYDEVTFSNKFVERNAKVSVVLEFAAAVELVHSNT